MRSNAEDHRCHTRPRTPHTDRGPASPPALPRPACPAASRSTFPSPARSARVRQPPSRAPTPIPAPFMPVPFMPRPMPPTPGPPDAATVGVPNRFAPATAGAARTRPPMPRAPAVTRIVTRRVDVFMTPPFIQLTPSPSPAGVPPEWKRCGDGMEMPAGRSTVDTVGAWTAAASRQRPTPMVLRYRDHGP